MTQERVNEIIANHQHWLNKDCGGWEGMRADFRNECLEKIDFNNAGLRDAIFDGAILRDANLRGAMLWGASFVEADLCNANLNEACLVEANFQEADLYNASLIGAACNEANFCDSRLRFATLNRAFLNGAKLSGANLFGASFCRAKLCETDLDGTDLRYTHLDGVYLVGAKNVPYIPMVCPEEGSFVGWKKVGKHIIKLEIPATAKRSSGTSRYCRCEYAKVLGIYTLSGEKAEINEIVNPAYDIRYKIGEMVYPDSFDENRWNECSHGIYFFINKQEAIDY